MAKHRKSNSAKKAATAMRLLNEWSSIKPSECVDRDKVLKFMCVGRPLAQYADALEIYDRTTAGVVASSFSSQRVISPSFANDPPAAVVREFQTFAGGAPSIDSNTPLALGVVYSRRLEFVFEAVAHGYLVNGREGSKRVNEPRYLSAAYALGCDEEDLVHIWLMFGANNTRFLYGFDKPEHDTKTEWREAKQEFGTPKWKIEQARQKILDALGTHGNSAAPTVSDVLQSLNPPRSLSRGELLEHLCGVRDLSAAAIAHAGTTPNDEGRSALIVIDIDCHDDTFKLPSGEVVPLDQESVRRRLKTCADAFGQPPALVVSSRRGFGAYAYWYLRNGAAGLKWLKAFAEECIVAVGGVVTKRWIETDPFGRLPLGFDCRILNAETLQPAFELAWDTKGNELSELRRQLPISTGENFRAGLLDNGVSPERRDDLVAENRAAPQNTGDDSTTVISPALRSTDDFIRLTGKNIKIPQRVITAGLSENDSTNSVMLFLTRYIREQERLQGEAGIARMMEILTLHPQNFGYSKTLKNLQTTKQRARDQQRFWETDQRHRWKNFSKKTDNPALKRALMLGNLPQEILATEVDDIMALELRKHEGGKRNYLAAERLLAFMLAMARLVGSRRHEGDRCVGWEVHIAHDLRAEIFREATHHTVIKLLKGTEHPATGKLLFSVLGGPSQGLSDHLLLGMPPRDGGDTFSCLEEGILRNISQRDLKKRYTKGDRDLIGRVVGLAASKDGKMSWLDGTVVNLKILAAPPVGPSSSQQTAVESHAASPTQADVGAGKLSLYVYPGKLTGGKMRTHIRAEASSRSKSASGEVLEQQAEADEGQDIAPNDEFLHNGPTAFLCACPPEDLQSRCAYEKAPIRNTRSGRDSIEGLILMRAWEGKNHPWSLQQYLSRRAQEALAIEKFCFKCSHADHRRKVRELWRTEDDSSQAAERIKGWCNKFVSNVPADGIPTREKLPEKESDLRAWNSGPVFSGAQLRRQAERDSDQYWERQMNRHVTPRRPPAPISKTSIERIAAAPIKARLKRAIYLLGCHISGNKFRPQEREALLRRLGISGHDVDFVTISKEMLTDRRFKGVSNRTYQNFLVLCAADGATSKFPWAPILRQVEEVSHSTKINRARIYEVMADLIGVDDDRTNSVEEGWRMLHELIGSSTKK